MSEQGDFPKKVSRNAVLAASVLASFLSPFMVSSMFIALPSIGSAYGATATELSWAVMAYLLASAVFLIPAGKGGDAWGRKKVFLAGAWTFALASLLCPLAPNMTALIFLRGAQGVGAALAPTMGTAILTSVFPSSERGKVLGINLAGVYAGTTAGPYGGGLLVGLWGWESIFFVTGALSLGLIAVLLFFVKEEWRDLEGAGFDGFGALWFAAMIVAVMSAVSEIPSVKSLLFAAVGLGAFCLFVLRMRTAEDPFLDLKLFSQNRPFVYSNVAAFIIYTATHSVAFLLSLYLQLVKGMAPAAAGAALLAQPLLQMIFSPWAGKLSDRREPRRLATGGMVCAAAGLVILAFLGRETSLAVIGAALAFLGVGFAFFTSPNTHEIMNSVSPDYYGVASGTAGTMRSLGQIMSMAVVTAGLTRFTGGGLIVPEQHDLLITMSRASFAFFALMCAVGVYFSHCRGAGNQGPS